MAVMMLVVFLMAPVAYGAEVNNSLFASVLDSHVKDGLVDYAGLKANRESLDEYLRMMGTVSLKSLEHDERLAFYLNLYNAATLQLIADHYPVDSIKDIGGFFSSPWKIKFVLLEGKMVTLDHIEHDIIRPTFKDPRVHFALNCSALSCPPLPSVPFEGDLIDIQLNMAAEQFVNDVRSNYLQGKTLYVSKIFDWFSEDFPDDFIRWFSGYARGELKHRLEKLEKEGVKLKVRYLKYDWGLNQQP